MADHGRCENSEDHVVREKDLRECVVCRRQVCARCRNSGKWKTANGEVGYLCNREACREKVVARRGALDMAGGVEEHARRFLLPAIELRLRSVLDDAGSQLDQTLTKSIDRLREVLLEPATAYGPHVSAVQDAAQHLSVATERLATTVETLRELGPALDPLVERMAHGDTNRALDSILQTSRGAKEVVQQLEAILPDLQRLLDMYVRDREREREHDWGILFRNSALGVLVTSLVLGIQIKAGQSLNPLLAVRLVWLALSVPIILTVAVRVIRIWRNIAGSQLASLAKVAGTDAFRREVAPRLITIIVLLVANVLIHAFL